MKEISIEIPEAQVPFMMEFLQKFNFVKISKSPEDLKFKLSKKQVKSVEEEQAKSKKNPGYLWIGIK